MSATVLTLPVAFAAGAPLPLRLGDPVIVCCPGHEYAGRAGTIIGAVPGRPFLVAVAGVNVFFDAQFLSRPARIV